MLTIVSSNFRVSCFKQLFNPLYSTYQKLSMSSTSCKVAVCQLTATNDKTNNLALVKRIVSRAVKEDAKVVFLPEACDYVATGKEECLALSEPLDGDLVQEYKSLAKDNKIWLSVGGFHEKVDENTVHNSHILIDKNGEIMSIYRKIHLFDVAIPEKNIFLKESDICVGGSQILPPVKTPAGNLALAICYDLRFPELSILQTKLGAEILTYPSAFTHTTGKAHWEILLRARAIENQCYVIAAAQYGKHNEKRISYGHSMIVDPWGRILAECPKYQEGTEEDLSMAVAEIKLEDLSRIRLEMPVGRHRRNDIYNLNLNQREASEIIDGDEYSFANKVIPGATVFYRSKYCFAFTNIRCVVPGHVLVSTLRPVPRLVDLSQEEIADLFQTTVAVQRVMEIEHHTSSSTICVQDGPLAGQTVPHVHVHVLPRKQGDFERNDDVYLQLAKHDRSDNTDQFRTYEAMSEEAKILRKYFL